MPYMIILLIAMCCPPPLPPLQVLSPVARSQLVSHMQATLLQSLQHHFWGVGGTGDGAGVEVAAEAPEPRGLGEAGLQRAGSGAGGMQRAPTVQHARSLLRAPTLLRPTSRHSMHTRVALAALLQVRAWRVVQGVRSNPLRVGVL